MPNWPDDPERRRLWLTLIVLLLLLAGVAALIAVLETGILAPGPASQETSEMGGPRLKSSTHARTLVAQAP